MWHTTYTRSSTELRTNDELCIGFFQHMHQSPISVGIYAQWKGYAKNIQFVRIDLDFHKILTPAFFVFNYKD
jgi:hypothetical protein